MFLEMTIIIESSPSLGFLLGLKCEIILNGQMEMEIVYWLPSKVFIYFI